MIISYVAMVITVFTSSYIYDAADPQLWSLQQSYTMPLLANGHTAGLLHGTLPRGRLDHVAATCSRYELRQAGGELEVDVMSGVKSYDHLLAGGIETETHTSGSGVQQSEVSPVLYIISP